MSINKPGLAENGSFSSHAPVAEHYTIAELSAAYGITPRALRFYEDEGLLAPRREGSMRIYGKRDRARLEQILLARVLGFSLAEARELIDLYDHGDGRMEQRRRTLAACRGKLAELNGKRAELDSTIMELTRFMARIEAVVLTE